MIAYRDTQLIFLFLIVAYTTLSIGGETDDGRELFPFFNWSLFSTVPADRYDYGIRILAIGDETLPEPLYLEEAEWFRVKTHSDRGYKDLIKSFGNAAKAENNEEMASARPQFESIYLKGKPVRYELVLRKYSPIHRLQRKGEFISERVLGEFKVGEKSP